MRHARWLAVLLVVTAAVQGGLAWRHQLWADEVFSLAMATGHSLEHPAAAAEVAKGDFVEAAQPIGVADLRRYAEFEPATAGVGAVLRAVYLSDTSPPLYYVLLHLWTRVFGVGDVALRSLSIVFGLACAPLVFAIGRRMGGDRAAWISTVLFCSAPLGLYYATEGRMYSQLWFCVLALVAATLRLHERRGGAGAQVAWIVASAAGLLTHYYFVFPWTAAVFFLLVWRGEDRRGWLIARAALVAAVVAPWYWRVPESLAHWRITADWITMDRAGGYHPWVIARQMLMQFFSGKGHFLWDDHRVAQAVAFLVFALALGAACWTARREALRGPRLLVGLWFVAACAGPLVVDFVRHTRIAEYVRYSSAALPAACLIGGWALARWRPRLAASALIVVIGCWSLQVLTIVQNRSRCRQPMADVARHISAYGRADDLVLVHSIPSGAIGLARYATTEAGFATWVGQLKQRRVPESLETLLRGRGRVLLVKVHTVGEPAPEETWLKENAQLTQEKRLGDAFIDEYRPRAGSTF